MALHCARLRCVGDRVEKSCATFLPSSRLRRCHAEETYESNQREAVEAVANNAQILIAEHQGPHRGGEVVEENSKRIHLRLVTISIGR